MTTRDQAIRWQNPSAAFWLLAVLMLVLSVAGGATRADVLGQIVVRVTAWTVLCVYFLCGPRPIFDGQRPVLIFIGATTLLILAQLLPLPPAYWTALPGRDVLMQAMPSGVGQPWRPLAIVPGAAWNALFSMVVPFAAFVLVQGCTERERRWMPGVVLTMILLSTIIGLLQFSGAPFDNPFGNDTPGEVSGLFANRNHFALALALGCMVASVWATMPGSAGWRLPAALGMILLFALTLLGSGSRAGILLGVMGICFAVFFMLRGARRLLRLAPRWSVPAMLVGLILLLGVLVLISFSADRAVSIDRAFALAGDDDMRSRGLPTVLQMVALYFPMGTGFGSFDTLFRMHEPFSLLKPTYFNHAHNDFLEIALQGGIAGVLLLAAAVTWWLVASVRVWWIHRHDHTLLPRLGSAMLFLVLCASLVDYPARTPMMMAFIVIAATWLASDRRMARSALPAGEQQL